MKRKTFATTLLVALGSLALAQSPILSANADAVLPGGAGTETRSFYDPSSNAELNGWPAFPGGSTALKAYFDQPQWYPTEAQESRLEGAVRVRFRVLPTGHITDVRVIDPKGTLLDQAAVEAVKKMPRWYPAYRNGQPVLAFQHIRVSFVL